MRRPTPPLLASPAGLDLDNDTAAALVSEAPLVASLPQGRLTMELGALLGYGGAARSLELLWRHGLLHLLLPQHAAYLKVISGLERGAGVGASGGRGEAVLLRSECTKCRCSSSKEPVCRGGGACMRACTCAAAACALRPTLTPTPARTTLKQAKRTARDYRRRRRPEPLFDLLRAADAHVHPQQPLDPAVWLALLAAPLVAKECAALVARSQVRSRRWKGHKHCVASRPGGTAQRVGKFGGRQPESTWKACKSCCVARCDY